MTHTYQMKHQSRMIESKARDMYMRLKNDYDDGVIKSQAEYYNRAITMLQTFYSSIDKPTLKVRKARDLPFSEDYNTMLNEINHDLRMLFEENRNLEKGLQDSYHYISIDQNSLINRIQKIEDDLRTINIQFQRENEEMVFRESFVDNSYFDKSMVQLPIANVSTQEGVLTLKPIEVSQYTEGATIRIVEGSGLPGNTKQVQMMRGQLHFLGEDNLHINLAELLDNNANTWFEYETFKIAEGTYDQVGQIGFSYDEGVNWIANPDESLRLMIEIELPFTQIINWFSINPFVPNDKGVSPALLNSIVVSDGKGQTVDITEQVEYLSNEKVYIFPQQRCKKITIHMEQESGYEVDTGHLFFKQLENQNINAMDTVDDKEGKRIDGKYPSVENLDIQYDPQIRDVYHPGVQEGYTITGVEKRKQNLFTIPETEDFVHADFEVLPAWRYMIGLREISIANYAFERESEYISHNFYSPLPITGLTLSTDEYIPSIFDTSNELEREEDLEWIEYYFSIDDGKTWNRIHPRGVIKENAKIMYMFNTNTPQEGRVDSFGYVDQTNDVHQIRMRIVIKRPIDIESHEHYTPYIKDYRLHLITEGNE